MFIKQISLPGGERIYTLARSKAGIIDPVVTNYVMSCLRCRSGANAQRNALEGVRRGIELMEAEGIDLGERISTARFLSRPELLKLEIACRMRRDGRGLVQDGYARRQFSSFVGYVSHQAETPRFFASPDEREILLLAEAAFLRVAADVRPEEDGQAPRPMERLGLSAPQRVLFLEAIEPGSPSNPFDEAGQLRSQVVMKVAYRLGYRSGEGLGLKLEDLRLEGPGPGLWIRRRHGDPIDPRRDQPVCKTRERFLPLSPEDAMMLTIWVSIREACHPAASDHPYVFVNRYGAPLSLRGLRKKFNVVARSDPRLLGGLSARLSTRLERSLGGARAARRPGPGRGARRPDLLQRLVRTHEDAPALRKDRIARAGRRAVAPSPPRDQRVSGGTAASRFGDGVRRRTDAAPFGRSAKRKARLAELRLLMAGDPEEEDRMVMSFGGAMIDTSEGLDGWRIDYRFVLDVARVRRLPDRVVVPVTRYLRQLVRTMAPATVYNTHSSLCTSFELEGVSRLLAGADVMGREVFEEVRRGQLRLTNAACTNEQLGEYRRFYLFHSDLCTPGFDIDVAIGLMATKLPGYEPGKAVGERGSR